MERESFENEDIGRLLSDNFVPIKVDREERPDVDKVYVRGARVRVSIRVRVRVSVKINIRFEIRLSTEIHTHWLTCRAMTKRAGCLHPGVAIRDCFRLSRAYAQRLQFPLLSSVLAKPAVCMQTEVLLIRCRVGGALTSGA